MKVKNLKPAPYNPRKISDKKLEMLGKSMTEFGDLSGIVYNIRTNRLVGGNQRYKHLDPSWDIEKSVHKDDVGTVAVGHVNGPHGRWAYREVDWDEKRELAANIAANKHGGEWDIPLLKDMFTEIDDGEFDIELTGFDKDELEELFGFEGKDGLTDEDAVPDVPEEPIAKTGDLWLLGTNRLLCGDATKVEDVERLMDGKKADMIFTDPPYNVAYKGRGKKTSNEIIGDNVTSEYFNEFLLDVFSNYGAVTSMTAGVYVFHASRTQAAFEIALAKSNFEIKNQIIWNKPSMSLGWGHYQWKHEPMFYAGRKGQDIKFYGDRTHNTVWDFQKTDRQLFEWAKKQKKMEAEGRATIWSMRRDKVNEYKHPTQKPVELIQRALLNSSKTGGIALDLFLGSGSTLIACEKTGRICMGMEIDPHYCDVIVKRWEDFTGKKAKLIESKGASV